MSRRAPSITQPNTFLLITGICVMLGAVAWYVYKQYRAEQQYQGVRTEQNSSNAAAEQGELT